MTSSSGPNLNTAAWALRLGAGLLGLLLLLGAPQPARAQGAGSREYALKAAFLYNFIKYVEWPGQALPPGGGTLVVGVLGRNPFGSALNSLNGKEARGKTIAVRQYNSVAEAQGCHVLFISGSEQDRMRQILDALRGSSILTVSEVKGFAQNGGMINFYIQQDKVRFEINPDAAERGRLNLSSQLLRLARIVRAS